MYAAWILVIAFSQSYGGDTVVMKDFPTEKACLLAAPHIQGTMIKAGIKHSVVSCVRGM